MDKLKTSLLEAFYKQLIEFNEQLILIFPEDKDFRVFKTGINLIKRTSGNQTIHRVFTKNIEEYRENIMSKNENFFLDNEYKNFLEKPSEHDISNIITKLKDLWRNLSDSNKEKVWGYLILLLNISDKIKSL